MPDYEEMYFQLAAKVADVIEVLSEAQRQGESKFIEEDPVLTLKENKSRQSLKIVSKR